jgi:hypothetical protein
MLEEKAMCQIKANEIKMSFLFPCPSRDLSETL